LDRLVQRLNARISHALRRIDQRGIKHLCPSGHQLDVQSQRVIGLLPFAHQPEQAYQHQMRKQYDREPPRPSQR
jgi:hypothetical protein